jgi:hypothetical protein
MAAEKILDFEEHRGPVQLCGRCAHELHRNHCQKDGAGTGGTCPCEHGTRTDAVANMQLDHIISQNGAMLTALTKLLMVTCGATGMEIVQNKDGSFTARPAARVNDLILPH